MVLLQYTQNQVLGLGNSILQVNDNVEYSKMNDYEMSVMGDTISSAKKSKKGSGQKQQLEKL